MGRIAHCITDLIGNTPMLELHRYCKSMGVHARILAKLEYFNPLFSVKDRVAYALIDRAEQAGILRPGGVIIEPTSGNTGIGLAYVAATKGYRIILTMPENMSLERRTLLKALGAEVVLTPRALGMKGAIAKAEALAAETPGAYLPRQFDNLANPHVHKETTGPEIWEDTDGGVDIFIAGVGTGGTITGVGEALKERKSGVQIVAVEPEGAPVLSGGKPGPHGLAGIGAGFVPEILNTHIYDEVFPVKTEEAYHACRVAARTEGVLMGSASGAALFAATEIGKREENKDKMIVILITDTGERYLSTPLFAE